MREHYKAASLDPRAAERLRAGDRTQPTMSSQHTRRPSYNPASSYAYGSRDAAAASAYGRDPTRYAAPGGTEQRHATPPNARQIYQAAPSVARPSTAANGYNRAASYSVPVVPERTPAYPTTSRAPVVPPYPYPTRPEGRTHRDTQPVIPSYPYVSAAPAVDYGMSGRNPRDQREFEQHRNRPTYDSIHVAYDSERSRAADEEYNEPDIHKALGWWPDQRAPLLDWDLSIRRSAPRYTKRAFDAQELASSPFNPPLPNITLILNTEYNWSFDISANVGERYITLQGLLNSIAHLMHKRHVPHVYWTRASPEKKERILQTMLARSGRRMPTVPPHRRPKTRGQLMEEAVLEDAEPGYTNLLVVDLLCENVMFSGMEFLKEPSEWLLRTTRRWS